MAPGDKNFYLVSYQNKTNKLASFTSRTEADAAFTKLGQVPKILMSGETGDLLASEGEQNLVD